MATVGKIEAEARSDQRDRGGGDDLPSTFATALTTFALAPSTISFVRPTKSLRAVGCP